MVRWTGVTGGGTEFRVYAPSPSLLPLQSINAWTGFTFAMLKCCTIADRTTRRNTIFPYHVVNLVSGGHQRRRTLSPIIKNMKQALREKQFLDNTNVDTLTNALLLFYKRCEVNGWSY